MASKFSLETVLSLTDGITGPINKAQAKMIGFSKNIKKHFGGFGNDMKKLSAGIDKVAIALGAVTVAGIAAASAIVQSTATSADAFIKQARIIGVTSEELQALTYAADLQGISSEELNKSLEKMMKNVGELRNGQGSLAKYLGETDRALLSQIKSAGTSEEVFTLLMGKMAGMTDEFQRAQFAQLAFGKSGMGMIKMAEGGQEAIAGLLSEAHQYGLITNEASEASELYLDELARMKAMMLGMKNQVFNALIPKLAEVATGIKDMLFSAEPGQGIIDKLKTAIEGIDPKKVVQDIKEFAGWLIKTFDATVKLIVAIKPFIPEILTLAAAIKVASIAMGIFNAVSNANIVSLIVLAIIAMAAAIAIGIRRFETFGSILLNLLSPFGQLLSAILVLKRSWDGITSSFKEGGILSGLKAIGATILQMMVLPVKQLLDLLSKIPGVGKLLGGARNIVSGFSAGLDSTINQYKSPAPGAAPATYASPTTFGSESRSFSETRTSNEVFVRPDKGAAVSTQSGGAPLPFLSYGRNQ